MEDIVTRAERLKRPSILVKAARIGLKDYNRIVHLRRLLKTDKMPGPVQATTRLLDLEAHTNELRRSGHAEYSVAGHIEIIVAILAEVQSLQAARREAVQLTTAPC